MANDNKQNAGSLWNFEQVNKDLGKVWLEYYTTRDKDSL